MTSCVIVALPAEDDPIWKVSSEKIPHLTILFLGEVEQNSLQGQKIISSVEHISNTVLSRFGLSVDRRGLLGDEDADVLFFDKKAVEWANLYSARNYMLKDTSIFAAYSSVEQYPNWTPHLTVGYPNAPARDSDEPHSFWIRFDKIAVWFGDFEGPEFLLKDEDELSMSDREQLDALEHYGIKGMHWGVRKNRPDGVSARTNREAQRDAKEFARAQMFYGEGAGTRRKLIKATVEAKSKKDPSYKKAYDDYLSKQDMSSHASKARSERKRKDVVKTTTKTSKGVYRKLTNGFGSVSLLSAIIASGYIAVRKSGIDKTIQQVSKKKISDIKQSRQSKKMVDDLLKNLNLV